MQDIKPGDEVRLKSGGPVMTVEHAGTSDMTGDDFAVCVWFNDKRELKRETFSPVVLIHA
ncbi:MAG: YodC family protein [Magnetospirillum sp.]